MSQKPTIVLVPGAGYPVETWHKIVTLMEAEQYKCVPVRLLSSASNAAATFLDDIQAVRSAILAETTQGRDVVVVVHSYGALPGHSASKGLTLPKDHDSSSSAASSSGHVLGFVGLTTGFTATGMCFLDGTGGKPPPSWRANEETGFVEFLAEPRGLFFHDVEEEEGKYWHAYAAWMDAPTWYLAATEDRALPVEAQRMFVQMAKDAGGDVTVREIDSSHSPMLSRPRETAGFIMEAAASFAGRRG
ncbi:Alpha/Beta hydrolase protein [Bombardia bombarda]|uniref:Alpha/Beta hydrolase protein n=1 Tax=Bombardia bombarda TaxID=252184 RepID=A0AA39XMA5_9PEZI|nr:Alpha/Beta hydrolase protein [Bombardia bombarda]